MFMCFVLSYVSYILSDTWKVIIPIIALTILILCDYKIMNILANGIIVNLITSKIDKIRDHS